MILDHRVKLYTLFLFLLICLNLKPQLADSFFYNPDSRKTLEFHGSWFNDNFSHIMGTFRFQANKNVHVGWRINYIKYQISDENFIADEFTLGAVWGFSAVSNKSGFGFHTELDVWAAIIPEDQDADAVVTRLKYGSNIEAFLIQRIRIGRKVSLTPALGFYGNLSFIKKKDKESVSNDLFVDTGILAKIYLSIRSAKDNFLILECKYKSHIYLSHYKIIDYYELGIHYNF